MAEKATKRVPNPNLRHGRGGEVAAILRDCRDRGIHGLARAMVHAREQDLSEFDQVAVCRALLSADRKRVGRPTVRQAAQHLRDLVDDPTIPETLRAEITEIADRYASLGRKGMRIHGR